MCGGIRPTVLPLPWTTYAPREYGRLDRSGHVYLDYTGGGLYAESQLAAPRPAARARVRQSRTRTTRRRPAPTEFVDEARAAVRDSSTLRGRVRGDLHANANGALKLVGEAYPFGPGRPLPAHLRQPQLGERHPRVRARARRDGDLRAESSRPTCASTRVARRAISRQAGGPPTTCSPIRRSRTSPACSTRLEWIEQAHEHGWDVLLDAAAFVPTNRLDLSRGTRTSSRSPSTRCSAGPPASVPHRAARGARQARAPVVLGRHDRRRVRAGARWYQPRSAAPRLRGRHRRLPEPAGGRDRPRHLESDRHRARSTRTSARWRPGCSRR